MAVDPKWASLRAAVDEFMTGGGSSHEMIRLLEQGGWKYDPPTPVLPVVSAPAETAFIAAAGLDGQNRVAGLRAAFKVMLRENLERLAVSDVLRLETQVSIGATRTGIYRILTGEEWPT